VAEDCFHLLGNQGLDFKTVTITAKDKICIFDKASCNPVDCKRAKGHYDRINDALFDLLTNNEKIDRQVIMEYSEKYMVCPYEMSLDIALFSDAVICDYNYVFDPNVYLKRFFAGDKKGDMIFLIDEAHNLVERGREMYSATLYKEDFLLTKRVAKTMVEREKDGELAYELRAFIKSLEAGNKQMLAWKHDCDDFATLETVGMFEFQLLRLLGHFDTFLKNYPVFDDRDNLLDFYFDLRHFINILEILSEKYTIYTDYDESNRFRVKLQCMDPSDSLASVLSKGKSAIFFSATLLPVRYYIEQLGGKEDDYAVYAPSSFPKENRGIFIARDVSTKYTRRNAEEYNKICEYLKVFIEAKEGNYLVFFPSYAYMERIYREFEGSIEGELIMQEKSMTEQEKEEFLERFSKSDAEKTLVGFCVLGGIFSEGIDLTEDRLIGAAIVGTGLPMVCNERELFMDYYQKTKGKGFDYAYLYQGMNKVLQSGGRVIRTAQDKGVILLLDERFLQKSYLDLFPREWFPYQVVDKSKLKSYLVDFWCNE
jgi:Rad3-related DNA helicase